MEVELPNGTIVEFPDGTSHDVIKQAISKKFGEKPNWGHKVGAAIEGVAQGLTFGYSDEIAAGLGSGFGLAGDYDEALESERARMSENQEKAGGYRLGGELAGALGGGVGLAKGGLTLMNKAKTLPSMIGLGAVEGAGLGGLYGSGVSEGGLEDRAKGAIGGGVAGGLMGGASPIVMSGLSKAIQPLKESMAKLFGPAAEQANARVAQVIRKSGMSPAEVSQKIDELGPEGMIVDVLGAQGEALARTAANVSPDARQALYTASTNRMAGQTDRLTESLMGASGLKSPSTLDDLQTAARKKAAPAINRAYKEARDAGYDLPSEPFDRLKESPMMRQALGGAEDMVSNRVVINDTPAGSQLAIYDEAKKILDAKAKVSGRKGDANTSGVASALARKLREAVDENIPEYAGARKLSQDAKLQEEAFDLGATGAKPTIAADYGAKAKAVDLGNRQRLAQGYAAGKIDQIANRRGTPGVVDALFGPQRQQDSLKAALGPNAMQKELAAERAFGNTDRAIKGGSQTAQFLSDAGAITGGAGLGMAMGGDYQSAGMGAAAAALARRGGGAMFRNIRAGKEAKVAPIIAEILTGKSLSGKSIEKLNKDPSLQKIIARMLSMQSGAEAPELMGP